MTIHQLSVFLENKKGTLLNVLNVLKETGIQIVASTIADTQEYGIYRIICSDSSRAYLLLKEAGVSVTLSDVFAVELDNRPGCAADALSIFADANINLNYMYSFLLDGKGILVFRTNDTEKARELIILNQMRFVSEVDLKNLN